MASKQHFQFLYESVAYDLVKAISQSWGTNQMQHFDPSILYSVSSLKGMPYGPAPAGCLRITSSTMTEKQQWNIQHQVSILENGVYLREVSVKREEIVVYSFNFGLWLPRTILHVCEKVQGCHKWNQMDVFWFLWVCFDWVTALFSLRLKHLYESVARENHP